MENYDNIINRIVEVIKHNSTTSKTKYYITNEKTIFFVFFFKLLQHFL